MEIYILIVLILFTVFSILFATYFIEIKAYQMISSLFEGFAFILPFIFTIMGLIALSLQTLRMIGV